MKRRLLLIVGMQKSGTTLLARLLEQTGHVARIDRGEGDRFWGNEPPFTPTAFPAGMLYQRHHGARGHELDASDACDEVTRTLHERLLSVDTELPNNVPLLFNKSPYNTVRLPWLRAIFPDAFIVATIRRPVPNVFSLVKKFVPHEGRGLGPEMGWWGVKPANWETLRNTDPIIQSAHQWRSVNARLLAHRGLVDAMIPYDRLCAEPDEVLLSVLHRASDTTLQLPFPSPPLHCADDEVERGARLKSRNRAFREHGSLSTPQEDENDAELPPMNAADIAQIQEICRDVVHDLELPA